ncbi:MAG: preprotein translocase subunit YajC, partial [Spirochaetales bacterium]|nr:preprotein translocase subunit YajC [Spirochaetales bacterium]
AAAPAVGGSTSGAMIQQFALMGAIFAVFYFLLIRPQQKKVKAQQDFLGSLQKGADVVTTGGIFGKITGITDTVVTLEIADNLRIKVARQAITPLPTASDASGKCSSGG